jgi:hypothetical protein
MADFQQPDTLVELPERQGRNGSTERLRLERSEWQGKPVYALRLLFQTPEGQWRWSLAKAAKDGRRWAALSLRTRELRALGAALIQAADEAEGGHHAPSKPPLPPLSGEPRRLPSAKEQRELERFDREHGPTSSVTTSNRT